MSGYAKIAILLVAMIAAFAAGVKWEIGIVAERDLAAATARRGDTIRQRQFNDGAGGAQAATVAKLSNQLGDAREKIARLSGRACLDSGTVGMLNNIGADPVRAAAAEPADAPEAASSGGGIRFATDADAARAIAICRARYSEVARQLDGILDIEDNRQGSAK